MATPDPPDPSDSGLLATLRAALVSNGYRSAEVEQLLTKEAVGAYLDGWFDPVRRRTESATPLATLSRLFALGFEVRSDDLDDVPGATLSDWVRAGLVAVRRGSAHPLASIQPLRFGESEFFLASDTPRPELGRPAFADFVPPTGPATWQLSRMTVRQPFASALDIGTGNGVLAIFAAQHCQRVVATDMSPRALAFTRFNLALNGVDNVEVRLGDRYEPVAGERFDLIFSSPAFVVSPVMAFHYRDSGLPADSMSETLVAGAADHAAIGGWVQVLCQWVHLDGERWQDRVGGWVAGTGCDAWAVQRRVLDPAAYASEWLKELGRVNPKEANREFDQWMSYYDREKIVGIGSGFVALHRSADGTSWYQTDEMPNDFGDDSGKAIAAFFDARTWLERHARPGEVLAARLRMPESVVSQASFRESGRRWIKEGVTLRQTGGLHDTAQLSDAAAAIVSSCDGQRPLGPLVNARLESDGVSLSSTDARYVRTREEVESLARRLVATGFLVPVED